MSETYAEQVSRVRMMAEGSATWDLSDNDTAALTAVLEHLDAYALEAMATRQEIAELHKDKARLDWLDKHGDDLSRTGYGADDQWWNLLYMDGNQYGDPESGADLRKVIDAAMEAKP